MWLRVGNLWTTVANAAPAEVQWLWNFLAYEDEQRERDTGYGTVHLLSRRNRRFPTGLVPLVEKHGRQAGFEVKRIDTRQRPNPDWESDLASADLSWLKTRTLGDGRVYQYEAVQAALRSGRGIVRAPTGCHAIGQRVIAFDGTLIAVEDVKPGDLLLGPDSKPRRVLELHRGRQEMVRIVPTKGTPWVVNLDHVLTLVRTNDGSRLANQLVDVTVREWLGWNSTNKSTHKLLRADGVHFGLVNRTIPVDPYFVGILLGDGCLSHSVGVANPEPEIFDCVQNQADVWGCEIRYEKTGGGCPLYRLVTPPGQPNKLRTALRRLKIFGSTAGNKAVPPAYLYGTKEVRRQCLAGILDTDGSLTRTGYDYISKSHNLADQVAFLSRSLGLSAYVKECTKSAQNGFTGTYWRVSVSGDCQRIPCRVARKKAPPRQQKKSVLRTGFTVELLPEDSYYGFTLDGDGRYLLDDYTITHNSGKGELVVGLCKSVPIQWLFLVHRGHLADDIQARWEKRGDGTGSAWIKAGQWELGERVTFSTFQTLYKSLDDPACRNALAHVQGVIVDEVHVLAADSFSDVGACLTNAYYRIGLSGTPLDRGDGRSLMAVAQTGPVIYNVTPQELMDAGYVARASVQFTTINHKHPGGRTWSAVRRSHIAESKIRNAAVLQDIVACEKPAIAFVEMTSHGRILRDAIRSAGLTCEFVWANTNKDQRKALVSKLNAGEIDVIVANDVFREGVDAPEIRSVINAAGGKSVIATVQRVGRGSRITNEKDEFTIYDYYDKGQRWLEDHSRRRVRVYSRYGYSVVRL